MKALSIANNSALRLAALSALSVALVSGCNLRSFALGEGSAEECDRGQRGCFCRVASQACDASLICIDDRCVDPVADGAKSKSDGSSDGKSVGSKDPSQSGANSTQERDKDSTGNTGSTQPQPEKKACSQDKDCDDGNPCTADACLDSVCRNIALSDIPCDDGKPCTASDKCVSGTCAGRETRVLSESFSGGMGQWRAERGTMIDGYFIPDFSESSWEVGPARASDCGHESRFNSGEDPARDFSPGEDNKLAGVVIGGCHEEEGDWDMWDCLFSPPVEVSFFDKEPRLSFYRHLHTPGMRVRRRQRGVEHQVVLRRPDDSIKTVLSGFEKRINDSDWVRLSRRLSPQKQPVSLGFCFRRAAGLPDFAGWSLDEIKIGQLGCRLEDKNE